MPGSAELRVFCPFVTPRAELCSDFAERVCTRGDRCIFVHKTRQWMEANGYRIGGEGARTRSTIVGQWRLAPTSSSGPQAAAAGLAPTSTALLQSVEELWAPRPELNNELNAAQWLLHREFGKPVPDLSQVPADCVTTGPEVGAYGHLSCELFFCELAIQALWPGVVVYVFYN